MHYNMIQRRNVSLLLLLLASCNNLFTLVLGFSPIVSSFPDSSSSKYHSSVNGMTTTTTNHLPKHKGHHHQQQKQYSSMDSRSALQLYTPEQEQDDLKKQQQQAEQEQEEMAAKANNEQSVSDQVLKSVTDKLSNSSTSSSTATSSSSTEEKKKDNKAMEFLKKVGRVGGAANKSFVNAVGSDEGSTGRQPPAQRNSGNMPTSDNDSGSGGGIGVTKKARQAYKECTVSGIIDDFTEMFPLTSSGTEWRGVSDRVMGGRSDGFIQRTTIAGKTANLLTGHVSLANNGGFIQMVTDLPLDPIKPSVDASDYDGIELSVLCRHEPLRFNIHLRTPGTLQQASYRHTVVLDKDTHDGTKWETIRIPFSSFRLYGSTNLPPTLDYSALRRIGIVAIGEEMDVNLAVSDLRFYCVI